MRAPSLCDKLGTGRAMPHDTERTLKEEVDLRRIPAKMFNKSTGFSTLASYTTPTRMTVIVQIAEQSHTLILSLSFGQANYRSNQH
jgi:hypothetical protein